MTLNYQRSTWKCRCKIHSTPRPSNHNCQNIRLHVKTKEWNTLSPTTALFATAKTLWTNVSLNTSSRAQKVCSWNVVHPGLGDRNNGGVKFTQSWNSAAYNCKTSLRKYLFEYESSRVHNIWRTPSDWQVHNYLYSFFVILPWWHDLENVT